MNQIIKNDITSIINSLKNEVFELNEKTILFAGGGGFLGFYFLNFFERLVIEKKINLKVIFIDNFVSSSKNFKNENKQSQNFEFLQMDICNPEILNLNYKIDYIVHAAGIASPHYYRLKPMETLDVSINGSKKYCFEGKYS